MESLAGPDNTEEARQQRVLALQEQLEKKHHYVLPTVVEIPPKKAS